MQHTTNTGITFYFRKPKWGELKRLAKGAQAADAEMVGDVLVGLITGVDMPETTGDAAEGFGIPPTVEEVIDDMDADEVVNLVEAMGNFVAGGNNGLQRP